MEFLQSVAEWLDRPLLHVGEWDITAFVLIRLVLYPLLAIFIAKWLRRLTKKHLKRHPHLDAATQNSVAAIVYYLFLVVGLLVALTAAGMPLQSLAVFSGAIGLGVGLGLQQFAQNFLSGLIILFSRPVRIGDWISFDGFEGTVQDIGAYSTVVRTADDGEVVVPNAQILNNKLTNWTRTRTMRRTSVVLPLGHWQDPEKLRRILEECASKCEGVLQDPKPSARVKSVRPGGVDWELNVWTQEFVTDPHQLCSRVIEAALSELEREKTPMGNP